MMIMCCQFTAALRYATIKLDALLFLIDVVGFNESLSLSDLSFQSLSPISPSNLSLRSLSIMQFCQIMIFSYS